MENKDEPGRLWKYCFDKLAVTAASEAGFELIIINISFIQLVLVN
jgi:hypothetical protein